MTGTQGDTKPHKTRLRPEARRLLKRLNTKPNTLDEMFRAAREYNDLEDALHHTLEYAEYLGEEIDELDASAVRELLDKIEQTLLKYEQDPELRQAAITEARKEITPTPGDDEPVAIALLVDLVSFTMPQGRLLTMLTRSMARKTFIDQTIIFDAPNWFARWISQRTSPSGVETRTVHPAVGNPIVLDIASKLWQPLNPNSPYRDAANAIKAARQLI